MRLFFSSEPPEADSKGSLRRDNSLLANKTTDLFKPPQSPLSGGTIKALPLRGTK